jgi:hypothetical protein
VVVPVAAVAVLDLVAPAVTITLQELMKLMPMVATVLDQAAMAAARVPQDREVVAVMMMKIIQPLQVGLVQFLFQYQMERQYQQVALP